MIIKNVRLINPRTGFDDITDIYIKENTNIRYTVMPQDTLFIYDKIEVKTE